MIRQSTKDRILDAALTLFSERGYDGVSVDQIAESVGIKGPSLYKHFKGKEELLDAIIDRVEEYYEENFGSHIKPGCIPSSMEELNDISLKRIDFSLCDDTVKKARRLLTMEQYRSKRIAQLASCHSFDGLLEMHSRIFQGMMDNGTIKAADLDILSMEYTVPISLLIQVCDRQPERMAEMKKWMEIHLKHFAGVYGASAEKDIGTGGCRAINEK